MLVWIRFWRRVIIVELSFTMRRLWVLIHLGMRLHIVVFIVAMQVIDYWYFSILVELFVMVMVAMEDFAITGEAVVLFSSEYIFPYEFMSID